MKEEELETVPLPLESVIQRSVPATVTIWVGYVKVVPASSHADWGEVVKVKVKPLLPN